MARTCQDRYVIPHCAHCARPCCALDSLVLELDWRCLQGLWDVRVPRRVFDAALARGEGPPEIRAREGLYYAHRRACPAYRDGRCAVYSSSLKPGGCDDFPVYEEGGRLVADLRCEAVDPQAVARALRQALGPGAQVLRSQNPEFPFLVTFRVKVPRPRRPSRRGRPRAGR